MTKTYVVADVHGRYDLLFKAMMLVREAVWGGDTFICLGDIVDRGPQSRLCLELLMGWQFEDGLRSDSPDPRVIVLRGNHEDIMLAALAHPAKYLDWWWRNGGGATLRSYGAVTDQDGPNSFDIDCTKVPSRHRQFLATLPYVHQDQHRIYVHAGIPWDKSVEETSDETKSWMLYGYDANDVEWNEPDAIHVSGKHIVHGHHQDASHPLLLKGRTDLDSFAWKTGRLAIGVFDDDTPGGPVDVLWAEGNPM